VLVQYGPVIVEELDTGTVLEAGAVELKITVLED
jgi:hypothetical protein